MVSIQRIDEPAYASPARFDPSAAICAYVYALYGINLIVVLDIPVYLIP